ncbi:hypothetical protein [Sulfurospirillum sp. 1612]|uniref:hypothetical protein n=1 Tax=Sulfurospirillum sp. 1612 TaxID=3094835 RepID=UPI002F91D41F
MIQELFASYRVEITFLHIISAVIWVGGMIVMRYSAHYSFQNIEQADIRLKSALYALKRLFILVSPFIVILLVTAIIMSVGLGFRDAALDKSGQVINSSAMHVYNLIHVKESIWTIMTLNYLAMVLIRNNAQKLLNQHDLAGAKKRATYISSYMVPFNIVLGIIAIFMGVFLRNLY